MILHFCLSASGRQGLRFGGMKDKKVLFLSEKSSYHQMQLYNNYDIQELLGDQSNHNFPLKNDKYLDICRASAVYLLLNSA